MNAHEWIRNLELEPHPEGGFYKSTYRSGFVSEFTQGERPLYTSIYFLLRSQDVSHFHRLQSDEIWYFHGGSSLTVHMITPDGQYEEVALGLDIKNGEVPQFIVSKHTIFGSSVKGENTFSLVGCMVSPGFDFADFELFDQEELLSQYPEYHEVIKKLT
ncbi:cupin domain-containing protein [Sporosarcina obsidiansis]|uniref:cupin domain-containing protein n=1 Tax=Sporosarcina obsidiansis TaxID=2660748 RepID=UPI00129A6303|nr:cupin domain-containing protein [Sporosarcina obsidiansis]